MSSAVDAQAETGEFPSAVEEWMDPAVFRNSLPVGKQCAWGSMVLSEPPERKFTFCRLSDKIHPKKMQLQTASFTSV